MTLCIVLNILEEIGAKMKQFKHTLFLIFFLISSTFGSQKLVFGVNPYKEPSALKEIYKELLDYLEKELGYEIVFVVSNDYTHLGTLIEAKKVDFASISPKLFSTVRQRIHGTQYLATIQIKDEKNHPKSTYRGLIIAQNDGTMNHISDLKGKRFGFTDKESTSGYFYPQLLLKEAGIDSEKDFSHVFMLKKHAKIIGALLEKSIDAGAIYEGTYEVMQKQRGDSLKILATTEEIPYDAIVGSPHLPLTMVENIKKALLKFESNTSLESGIVGFEEKPVSVYDRLSTLQ
jgi:phosphonate transport system substrate-binding protein